MNLTYCTSACRYAPSVHLDLFSPLQYKLYRLLMLETIMRWGAGEYQQLLKKKAFCHQQEFDESGVFDDLKTSPPLTDLFLHFLLLSYQCIGIAGNWLTVLVILLYMGRDGDRRGERRSRSRDRQKQKKHHKKRDFSSSSQEKERKKHHRKHKEHRRSPESQSYRKRQQPKEEPVNAQPIVKEVPCWEPSGILLQFYNARDGVSLKFHEPPESRPPNDTWKIYVFKGDEVLQPIELSASCFLMGKDERICDILCLNPSISRQHAVIQFRLISKMNIEGDYTESIKPYVMDLGSTNGTFLNDQQIEPSRYYELLHKDVLRLGHSDRLYVLVKDQGAVRHAEYDQ